MLVTSTPRRRLATAAAATCLLAGLAGCSPARTNLPYAASDGIRASVADVSVANLLVLASDYGRNGRVLAAFSNSGASPADLAISIPSGTLEPTTTTLEPGESINFNASKALLV